MSTRRFSKVVYLRTTPERHSALHAYAAHQDTTVTQLVDGLIDHLLAEAVATPVLSRLESRISSLEQQLGKSASPGSSK